MKRIEYEKIHDVIFFFFFFFSQRISLVQNFLILYSTPSREHPPRSGVTSAYTGVNSTCLPGKARKEQQEEEKEYLWIFCGTQSNVADYVQTGKRSAEDNREINRSHRLIVG